METPETILPGSPLPLDYAGPTTKETHDQMLERLMLAGDVEGLLRHFPNASIAAQHYADFLCRHFQQDHVDGICQSCGDPTHDVAKVRWQLRFTLNEIRFDLRPREYGMQIHTFHSFCGPCMQEVRRREAIGFKLIGAAVAMVAIGLVLYMLCASQLPIMQSLQKECGNYLFIAPAAVIVLGIALGCMRARVTEPPDAISSVIPDGVIKNISAVPPNRPVERYLNP